jgi:integrase
MNWDVSITAPDGLVYAELIESGVPLKVVSEILGHFSVSITGDIYGHVSPDVSAQAMDALGSALDG